MKIVSKDLCTFKGFYTAIYIGPCRRSYILLVQKFRISEMLDKWSPTPKLSNIKFPIIQTVDIFYHLYENPPVFWHLQIFSLVYYDWILSIG